VANSTKKVGDGQSGRDIGKETQREEIEGDIGKETIGG
jgi:hypothetical protein